MARGTVRPTPGNPSCYRITRRSGKCRDSTILYSGRFPLLRRSGRACSRLWAGLMYRHSTYTPCWFHNTCQRQMQPRPQLGWSSKSPNLQGVCKSGLPGSNSRWHPPAGSMCRLPLRQVTGACNCNSYRNSLRKYTPRCKFPGYRKERFPECMAIRNCP